MLHNKSHTTISKSHSKKKPHKAPRTTKKRHLSTAKAQDKVPAKTQSASLRGTKDYYPNHTFLYRHIQSNFESVLSRYGYNNEIRTPVIEHRDVFGTTLGQDSDVVMKQMYLFDDFGTPTVLRPENTASTVRSIVKRGIIETTANNAGVSKATNKDQEDVPQQLHKINYPDQFFYCGPMFRREKPQNGRLRQFTQFGIENIGTNHLQDDVQAITMAHDCLKSIGLSDYITLAINTIGTLEERQAYSKALYDYLLPFKNLLSPDSQKRFEQGHILRILDSSDEFDLYVVRGAAYCSENIRNVMDSKIKEINATTQAQQQEQTTSEQEQTTSEQTTTTTPSQLITTPPTGAPLLRHHLSEASLTRFNAILLHLKALNIPYKVDDFLIRGLDYYCHTTFEFLVNTTSVEKVAVAQNEKENITWNAPTFITKQTPLQTLPFGSYQAVLAGGRYEGIAQRFDKYKPNSSALQPLNLGIGWASGVERVILHMDRLGLITDDLVAKGNDIVDIVVTTMGAKRSLMNGNYQEYYEALQHVEQSGAERQNQQEIVVDFDQLNNITTAFPPTIVAAMKNQMAVWDVIKKVKQAAKDVMNDDKLSAEQKSAQTQLLQITQPPLPHNTTQIESITTLLSLTLAQKLRAVGERNKGADYRVLFQPHLNYQKQLGSATNYNAKYAVIVGEEEVSKDGVMVKNLATREQHFVSVGELESFFLDKLGGEQQM